MQNSSTVRSKILNATSYEFKLLLRGILLPACIISFFTYVTIALIDTERSGYYNSIPSAVILSFGTIILLKLLFQTKLERTEIRRFRFIFLSLICWLIGELIYVYHQAFLGIAVPYPSVADIFYLSATVFLSFHLYNILFFKKNIRKTKSFLYLGLLASAFPIYFLVDSLYHYEEYYPNSVVEFVVNISYYISDAVVIFPCIPIILYSPKNDPFIFHWLSVALSVFILVAADVGYTFMASINEELLQNTEWLWSFVYSVGYILLSVAILWFSKLKQILEYKKFSETLRIEQDDLDRNDWEDDFIEKLEGSTQIISTMRVIAQKAEKDIDILFTQYIIQKNEITKLINMLADMTGKNRLLNIRMLLPSHNFHEEDIQSSISSKITIKYFDSPLSANGIASIIDSNSMYVLSSVSANTNGRSQYIIQQVRNDSKVQVYVVLFERMWLLEKSVDFG
jgi:hypothetical protein